MVDSEEDCDTWRNRDKYPKERESTEKKASPSPAEQKIEKRPFNSFSPTKSIEPPFKRQKNNVGDDFGVSNSNRRDNFENRRDNFDSRKDSYDNRGNSYDNRNTNNDNRKDNFESRRGGGFENRRGNFDNRKNDFDSRRENFENRRDGFENRRESYDGKFSNSSMVKTSEDIPNYPTQPQMLLFKHFLQQQEDNIEMEVAMTKYNEYKDSFVRKQLKAFFDSHNSQEWFKEKYLPSFVELNKLKEFKNIELRKEIFMYLMERQWMDNIKLHVDESDSIVRLMDAVVILLEGGNENDLKILDSRRYRSESPNDTRMNSTDNVNTDEDSKLDPNIATKFDLVEKEKKLLSETKQEENDMNESRPLHRTFSIFLRNLHPNVLRSEIEALVKPYPGFLRLALQDPTPDRKFFRRGWVTYDRTVNIKEICWNLNNIRLHDCDIGAIVNRELTQRVRPVNVLTNHKPVMRQDIKLAAKLVAKFDKRHSLWEKELSSGNNPMCSKNPLLKNITEYLVDEGSYEEEALLGGNLNCNLELTSSGGDPSNITIDCDDKSSSVLDKLVLYLRFVHSYDYYSNTEYQIEDEMPHRCGIIHARGAHIYPDRAISQKDVEEYIKTIEAKAESILNCGDILTIEEAKRLGYRELEEVEESFITSNTQEIAQDKWLCPLSGKKFKGPDFVRKHILNKHLDKMEEVKQLAAFFNNYLLDGKRPQLPEHPLNRVGGAGGGTKTDSDSCCIIESKSRGDSDIIGRVRIGGGGGRRNDDFDRPRNNYRASSPSDDNSNSREYGSRSNLDSHGGNNGSYYRKSNFVSRGGNQGRQRNGGLYYSRNMMTYNDLDAPADD